MPTIHLTNFIEAPIDRVYQLSCNSSIHKLSFQQNKIWPVAGITSGPLQKEDSATWKTKFLFKTSFFTSKIIELLPNEKILEKIIKSDFPYFIHEHFFKPATNGTILIDIITYETPAGWMGWLMNKFYINSYLEKLLRHRIEAIKQYAEGEKWRALQGS